MTRRLIVLTGYFFRRLVFSVVGLIYIILALVYWAIFFPPGQGTPDISNYMVIIGAFGVAMTFLATLSSASRAFRAENYPLIVRLPSRVEYITAVFFSSIFLAFLLQLLVAGLAMIRGPQSTIGQLIEIPPVWIALNLLSAMLALHASDLVASGWSRVLIFGILAILLIGQNLAERMSAGLASIVGGMSSFFYGQQWLSVGNGFGRISSWLQSSGRETIDSFLGIIFWPFRALSEAIFAGYFTPTQALAPAVIILYATILFLIAADLFATKDLDLTE